MTKNLRLLFFDLLEFLAEDGIGSNVNIKEFCEKYELPEQAGVTYEYPIDGLSKRLKRVFNALEEIRKTGLIKYSDNPHEVIQLIAKDGVFEVSITKEGLDYYYIHLLRKATIKSFGNQRLYNGIALGIAGVSLIVSTTMSIVSNIQKDELSDKLEGLNRQVQQLKSQQHSRVATHKTGDTVLKKP